MVWFIGRWWLSVGGVCDFKLLGFDFVGFYVEVDGMFGEFELMGGFCYDVVMSFECFDEYFFFYCIEGRLKCLVWGGFGSFVGLKCGW